MAQKRRRTGQHPTTEQTQRAIPQGSHVSNAAWTAGLALLTQATRPATHMHPQIWRSLTMHHTQADRCLTDILTALRHHIPPVDWQCALRVARANTRPCNLGRRAQRNTSPRSVLELLSGEQITPEELQDIRTQLVSSDHPAEPRFVSCLD